VSARDFLRICMIELHRRDVQFTQVQCTLHLTQARDIGEFPI
jgi:hypothetical protein